MAWMVAMTMDGACAKDDVPYCAGELSFVSGKIVVLG
jgi:hypothetical protein